MKNIKITISLFLAFFVAPASVFAAAGSTASSGTLQSIVQFLVKIVSMVLPALITLVFVYFFWGLAKYVSNVGDEKKEAEGRAILTWGVIAVFVGVSLYGIIGWLQTFFGTQHGPTSADLKIDLPHL